MGRHILVKCLGGGGRRKMPPRVGSSSQRGISSKPHAWVGTSSPLGGRLFGAYPAAVISAMGVSLLCTGVAIAMLVRDSVQAEVYNAKVQALSASELGWIYLSAFLLKTTAFLINCVEFVCRSQSNIPAPDQYVYNVVGKGDLPVVLMA